MSNQGITPELLESVNKLRGGVVALTNVLEEDYPKREEVERRFTKKKTFYRGLGLAALMFVIGVVASYFVTFSTLSVCFLTADQNPSGVCKVIPGYEESLARNDTLLHRFQTLVKTTKQNERQIAELEEQLSER